MKEKKRKNNNKYRRRERKRIIVQIFFKDLEDGCSVSLITSQFLIIKIGGL